MLPARARIVAAPPFAPAPSSWHALAHAEALGGPRLSRPRPPGERRGALASARRGVDDGLSRVRPHFGQPARGQPSRDRARCAGSRRPATGRFSSPGGGTGLIGDPGGKSDERPLLSLEQLAANLEGIRAQLEGLLDLSPRPGRPRACWSTTPSGCAAYGFIDFLRDVGKHFTVNQMVAKESVRTRLERPDQGISYTEFSYMLLQAYDYLYLHDAYGCRLQIGGSDQWGNITMGLELIRKVRGAGGLRPHLPAAVAGGRDQVRKERVRGRVA